MEFFLAAIEASEPASALRTARWGYAAVSTAHILGIALLVGPIVALDLRLMGMARSVPIAPLVRMLRPVAIGGLLLAVCAGAALFSVQASHYAGLDLLRAKLALILLGIAGALALHRAGAAGLSGATQTRLRVHGVLSICCWLGALICGRLIAFVDAS